MRIYRPGITAIVGDFGSGKTYSMVQSCEQARSRDCLIATNFKYEFEDFALTTFDDWLDLLDYQMSLPEQSRQPIHFAIDEMGMLLNARDWAKLPAAMNVLLMQPRKFRVSVAYSVPNFESVDVALRRPTSVVVQSRGHFPYWIRIPKEWGTLYEQRHLLHSRVAYKAEEFGKARSERLGLEFFRMKRRVHDTYDTLRVVSAVQAVLRKQRAEPGPDVVLLDRA